MPLRMTRLAVSRALVSATTLPPLTTSCGEPTPGLAHGINSSRLPIPRCAIDMQRRHPTRSRREAGVATLTPGPRICLSASSGAAGTKGSSRRGARVRAYRQRTCLQQLATSGHLFSGLACASIAPTRRVLRRRGRSQCRCVAGCPQWWARSGGTCQTYGFRCACAASPLRRVPLMHHGCA